MSTLIFGDSFVGPFKLIDDKNINIYTFSGYTMKGITKKDNKNRKKIIEIVNNISSPKCMVFNFGQVDLYFSYYYKKFIKNEKFEMEPTIKKYVKFINSLNCNNCNKIILSVYPTVLKDKYVFKSLLKYKILSEEDVKYISKSDKEQTSNFSFRYNMYLKFNNLLQKYCKVYNVNYINLDNELLDKKTNRIKQQFVNPSTIVSIHLLWEPLIPILVKKITDCNIMLKYKVNLKKSLEKYIIEKKIIENNRENNI